VGDTNQKAEKVGVFPQAQKGYVMLRFPLEGKLTSQQMKKLAEIAKHSGRGFVLLTMRKSVELPWIKYEEYPEILQELASVGLKPGSWGYAVRNVVACAAQDRCPFALENIENVRNKIARKFYGVSAPRKFRVTLSGCANYCSHPYFSEFGMIGRAHPRILEDKCIGCGQCVRLCRGDAGGALSQVNSGPPKIDYEKCIECGWCIKNCPTGAMEAEKTGFTILAGGKGGRHPKLAHEIARIVSEEEAFKILDKTLEYFRKFAKGRERLTEILERNGVEHFKNYVLKGVEDAVG